MYDAGRCIRGEKVTRESIELASNVPQPSSSIWGVSFSARPHPSARFDPESLGCHSHASFRPDPGRRPLLPIPKPRLGLDRVWLSGLPRPPRDRRAVGSIPRDRVHLLTSLTRWHTVQLGLVGARTSAGVPTHTGHSAGMLSMIG